MADRFFGNTFTPGEYGPDKPEDAFDWWQAITKIIDKYEKLMPRDPAAEAEVNAIRKWLSQPQFNPEQYKAKIRQAEISPETQTLLAARGTPGTNALARG